MDRARREGRDKHRQQDGRTVDHRDLLRVDQFRGDRSDRTRGDRSDRSRLDDSFRQVRHLQKKNIIREKEIKNDLQKYANFPILSFKTLKLKTPTFSTLFPERG